MSSSNGDVKTRMPNPLRRLAAMGMIGAFVAVALLSGCSKEDPDTYDPNSGSTSSTPSDDKMIQLLNSYNKARTIEDQSEREAEASKYYCKSGAADYTDMDYKNYGADEMWRAAFEVLPKYTVQNNAKHRYETRLNTIELQPSETTIDPTGKKKTEVKVEYVMEDGDWKLCSTLRI